MTIEGNYSEYTMYFFKVLIIIISVVLNKYMLEFFMHALKQLGTGTATILNFSINFCFSVFY